MYSCNNPVNTELLSFPQNVILTLCSVFTGYIVSLRWGLHCISPGEKDQSKQTK